MVAALNARAPPQVHSMDAATRQDQGRSAPVGGIARLISADAQQTLAQLQGSPILSEGKVCLIGLDAIREQLGARWPARRAMVHEHMERTLQRQLGAHGLFLRLSETDYLVTQPGVSRLTGQAYCLNCLREVLKYFLGEALVTNIVVHEVTSIGVGEVSGSKLDVGEVEEAEITERASGGGLGGAIGPSVISQDRWSPFMAGDGRRLRASCQLEPVFQLKTYGRIGYRMIRSVLEMPAEIPLSRAEHRKLASTDIERIDFATLSRGLNRLQQDAPGKRQPSLILPVSFVTLSSQRGRTVLVDFFRAAQASVQQGLICEVCDLDGVPPGALLAATSLIRPFCRFVVANLDDVPTQPLLGLKDTGLQGLSIARPAAAQSDEQFGAFARAVLAAARPVAKTVMIYGLAGARHAAIAEALGATHGSFAPVGPKLQVSEQRTLQPAL